MPNPSQEPPVSSKARNQDLKDIDVLCTFNIKIVSQNFEYGCIKDQWPYLNQHQDAKPQSGASIPHQSPKSGLIQHHNKRAKILNMGVSKTSDYIQIKIKMPNPIEEPPVSS